MSGMQRYFVKCLGKFTNRSYHRVYRRFSATPSDDKKTEKVSGDGDADKSGKKPCHVKKTSLFKDHDNFLPDRKSDIKVGIIGGGTASIYTAVLLKQSRLIKCVHLIDPKETMSVAVFDASHIDTSTRIKYFKKKNMSQALKEMNIIALMDESDVRSMDPKAQFNSAADYVRRMTEQMLQFNSHSLVVVFVQPVTASLVMVSELYKYAGWWDPDRIIGSTALDCMRMEAITANLLDLDPAFLSVPMVAGADPNTIVPLLSRARPADRFTNAQHNRLVQSLRGADKQLASTESKGPTISAGAAAAKLILTLAGGLSGLENMIACAYVRSDVLPVCRFFTSELQFGTTGIRRNFGLPKITPAEIQLIEEAIPFINEYTKMAVDAVHKAKLG